jgi:cyclopropane-fatty-acyl-phospholipid synthase
MQCLLDRLGRGFTDGCLEFAAPDGRTWTLGQGLPRLRLRLRTAAEMRRILWRPPLSLGERYVAGGWDPENASLAEVLELGVRFCAWREQRSGDGFWQRLRSRLGELNDPQRSRRNVEHHYDLDEAFYARFLDRELHYSCAYYERPGLSLEQAQRAKCALIARKLDLRPGARVLDIGCGWGSLALHLAEHQRVQVTGITLSPAQWRSATRRAAERGLDGRVEFRLADYRHVEGDYDAIVSVGMFEHVGRPQYRGYFRRIAELLRPEGTALLHTIGRHSPPGSTNPWIRRYIFPGGYIPAASELLAAVEPSGLRLNDLEVWRQHYAETLAEWHRRFQAARASLPAAMDERFCRMWAFYLQASEASFRSGELVVFQLQLTRALTRLPLTRDYLYANALPLERRRVA